MKPTSISAETLFEAHRETLRWQWVAGHAHPERQFAEAAVREARPDLVIHLAAHRIDAIVPQLLAGGYRPDTPAAVVAFASWPQQVILRGTLSGIADQMHDAAITRTAVIIVGDVLAAEGFTDSYLYSSGRTRGDRH